MPIRGLCSDSFEHVEIKQCGFANGIIIQRRDLKSVTEEPVVCFKMTMEIRLMS